MVLIHVARWISLLQDAFKVGVHDKWDSFLSAVVLETQPLVILIWQPDSAIVHLTAVCRVDLQFFI